MRVAWRNRAERDLDDLYDYLIDHDLDAARRIRDAIRRSVDVLRDHPALGRPGRAGATRELIIAGTHYIVAYTIDRQIDAVVILRVLHGARRWPDEL